VPEKSKHKQLIMRNLEQHKCQLAKMSESGLFCDSKKLADRISGKQIQENNFQNNRMADNDTCIHTKSQKPSRNTEKKKSGSESKYLNGNRHSSDDSDVRLMWFPTADC
jgi:hypothetical protein